MSGLATITDPTQDELRALWGSGFPLDDAWVEFTPDNFDRITLQALQSHPDDDAMFERASNERVRKRYQEMKGWLPMTFEGRQAKLRNKIEVQRSYLLDNLYKGDLWAIGSRTLASGFDELARVPRHFFFTDYEQERNVSPNVYWTKGEVTSGDESYFDVHVIRAPVRAGDGRTTSSDPERDAAKNKDAAAGASRGDASVIDASVAEGRIDDDDAELPRVKPGRPSEGEVILAAIAAYAATDRKLKKPRSVRYDAYKSYISLQGYDPRRDPGFSDKTLQKYETKFRKKNR